MFAMKHKRYWKRALRRVVGRTTRKNIREFKEATSRLAREHTEKVFVLERELSRTEEARTAWEAQAGKLAKDLRLALNASTLEQQASHIQDLERRLRESERIRGSLKRISDQLLKDLQELKEGRGHTNHSDAEDKIRRQKARIEDLEAQLKEAREAQMAKKSPAELVDNLDIRIKLLHPPERLVTRNFRGGAANFRVYFTELAYVEVILYQESDTECRITWPEQLKFTTELIKQDIEVRLIKAYRKKVDEAQIKTPPKQKAKPRPGHINIDPGDTFRIFTEHIRSRDPFSGHFGTPFGFSFDFTSRGGRAGPQQEVKGRHLPWGVLGLQGPVEKEEAESAYRKLAKLYHPDKAGDATPAVKADLERKMTNLNNIWARIKKEMGW